MLSTSAKYVEQQAAGTVSRQPTADQAVANRLEQQTKRHISGDENEYASRRKAALSVDHIAGETLCITLQEFLAFMNVPSVSVAVVEAIAHSTRGK